MSAVGYDLKFAAETIWKVGLVSLLLGAGLPMLYAVGIRALAWGAGGDAEASHARPNPVGKVLAVVIFVVVLYAIASGIVYVIATGKGSNYDITFRHLIPEITQKAS
jgi:hypothetical protein